MASHKLRHDQQLQERNLARLRTVTKLPGNSNCADCGAPFARFASVTIGVFLCNRCYGIHRAVGAHVTRTKCIGLDTWSAEEVQFMASHGNVRANQYWLRDIPPGTAAPNANSSNDEVERWIRAKYEKRLFCGAGSSSSSGSAGSERNSNSQGGPGRNRVDPFAAAATASPDAAAAIAIRSAAPAGAVGSGTYGAAAAAAELVPPAYTAGAPSQARRPVGAATTSSPALDRSAAAAALLPPPAAQAPFLDPPQVSSRVSPGAPGQPRWTPDSESSLARAMPSSRLDHGFCAAWPALSPASDADGAPDNVGNGGNSGNVGNVGNVGNGSIGGLVGNGRNCGVGQASTAQPWAAAANAELVPVMTLQKLSGPCQARSQPVQRNPPQTTLPDLIDFG